MKSMDKIVVYGNFMLSKPGFGGQITKTRSVFNCLIEKYGKENVIMFNMEKWKKKPFSTLHKLTLHLKKYKHFVVLPGDNNLKLLLILLKKYIIKYKVHVYYMVVGGWLYNYLKNKKKKIEVISCFSGIFVETVELMNNLKSIGLNNVFYSPVFSLRKPITEENLTQSINYLKAECKLRFCTFSRVLKEKGITDAIDAIVKANNRDQACSLDIYGAVDKRYKKEFTELLAKHKRYVSYKGFIEDNNVIETLSKYHSMIFATYYYGEGFPATLLEANMAGLPVLASKWKYNGEIVHDGVTGYLFEPKNIDSIVDCILKVANSSSLYQMRYSSLKNASNFTPEKALQPLYNCISENLYEK